MSTTQPAFGRDRFVRAPLHESEAVRLTFLDATRRAPFPAFWPLVDYLVAADPFLDATGRATVRDEAAIISAWLGPQWMSISESALIDIANDVLNAACSSASSSSKGHCVAARAQWAAVKRHSSDRNRQPLVAALDAFRRSIRAALATGGISVASAKLLVAYADRLEQMA